MGAGTRLAGCASKRYHAHARSEQCVRESENVGEKSLPGEHKRKRYAKQAKGASEKAEGMMGRVKERERERERSRKRKRAESWR